MKPVNTAVVGSGLVGTLLSIFLARRGFKVDLYERRSDMRQKGYVGGRSINLAMSHRGWTALKRIGIDEQIFKTGVAMPGRMMHSVAGDLTFQPYGKEGQAIFSVSRGGLNLALLEIAGQHENINIHFDSTCIEYDLETSAMKFRNETDGSIFGASHDYVFGVDGAYSAIRYGLQKLPGFNYSQIYLDHGYKELHIPPLPGGGFQMDPNALHIWPRGNFMLIALPNPDGSFTCTLFLPLKGENSFEQISTDQQVLDFFEKWFKDSIPLIEDLVGSWHRNPTSMLMQVSCKPWNYKNTVLMGDASHAITPFFGQGMNAGFEDCVVLDQLLDQYLPDWETVFSKLSDMRFDNASAIAELARRNFVEMRDLVGDPKFLLRKKIAAHLHEKYPTRFVPVYTMVSFSDTPYADALREDDKQNRFFAEILNIPDIENNWDGEAVDRLFNEWYS